MLATKRNETLLMIAILVFAIVAPILFPAYTIQITFMWMMVLFALTWDAVGGQMGYNSLGNIAFFGMGNYIGAVVQIMVGGYDVGEYTSAFGAIVVDITETQYFTGVLLGAIVAGIGCILISICLGFVFFGLRGPYFAIGTLGFALTAGELMSAWRWVGAGSGISMPLFPNTVEVLPEGYSEEGVFYYVAVFLAMVACFFFYKWLYGTRFGLAVNAIRDDEQKAEGMGIHTMRYKQFAWASGAFFMGIAGAFHANMVHFIDREVAFPVPTFGIFMVAMALLGGKGTLWGPVLGAVLFHVIKEVTWTHLLGWQYVALGMLIIINIVFFQQGIVGWLKDTYPEKFGIKVDTPDDAPQGAEPEGASR